MCGTTRWQEIVHRLYAMLWREHFLTYDCYLLKDISPYGRKPLSFVHNHCDINLNLSFFTSLKKKILRFDKFSSIKT
jgi:hypothetical protein